MDEFTLTQEQKAFLLGLARDTIRGWIVERRKPSPSVHDITLQQPCGAFVTLTESGELRGCIGQISARSPLYQTVIDCAVSSAVEDPRFPPLRPEDLDRVDIEISVLSPLRTVSTPEEVEVGRHGLVVSKGYYKGLLLPQVATQHGWDTETFLAHTCLKAGLPSDAWKKGAKVEVFSALVFGE